MWSQGALFVFLSLSLAEAAKYSAIGSLQRGKVGRGETVPGDKDHKDDRLLALGCGRTNVAACEGQQRLYLLEKEPVGDSTQVPWHSLVQSGTAREHNSRWLLKWSDLASILLHPPPSSSALLHPPPPSSTLLHSPLLGSVTCVSAAPRVFHAA